MFYQYYLCDPAWNKDWQPGPYPRTAKERAAAAKKYGLLPEDYEPYPDDGMGYGDYPKLPPVPTIRKSQYEQYDLPYLRRNYGETVCCSNTSILYKDRLFIIIE